MRTMTTGVGSICGYVPPKQVGRTGLWALTIVTLLAASTGCSSSQSSSSKPTASASPTATPLAGPDSTASASSPTSSVAAALGPLVTSGIQVVAADDNASTVDNALRITEVQARRLIADVGPGAGLLGSDIDRLAPVVAGVPPASYLVAAWVSSGGSAAASTARDWMGSQDWTRAPTVRYPVAVLAMFVSEIAVATDREMPPGDAGQPTTQSSAAGTTVPAGSGGGSGRDNHSLDVRVGPCSAVTGFLASVIQGLFGALRITPSSGSGVFDVLASTLASIWNVAVGLAQAAVEGLVKQLTAPVFAAIRVAVGALGVATVIVSYFKDQTLTVDLAVPQVDPGQYPFAVGAAVDVTGQFVAKGRELTGDWPPALVDCASVAGVALPELIKPGAPATWTVDDGSVIVPGPLSGTVTAERTATLSFVTGRESEEIAQGEAVVGDAIATVKVPRKEIDDFLAFATAQIAVTRDQLLAAVPAGALQTATAALLAATVDPTAKQITDEISGAVGGVFSLSGSAIVVVLHHMAPDTTTSASTPPPTPPPPSSDGQGDFCTQYKATVDWLRANPPGDVVAWANEIVRRLTTLRPLASGDLGAAVDVELGVYSAVAAQANAQVIIQRAQPLAAAALQLGAFCGVPAS